MKIAEYSQLLVKVEAKFDEISSRHPDKMSCSRGCSSCCQPGMSVSKVEQQSIQFFLGQHPEIQAVILAGEHPPDRCYFLSSHGDCQIYEVRPIICRSHGAPVFRESQDGSRHRQICRLNFSGFNLDELDGVDFFNLDLLNTLLALINKKYFETDARNRYVLDENGVITGTPSFAI